MPQAAAPTGPPRPPTCSSRRSSGSGMASATSPTTAYGCCCTAASGGRRTAPQDCEAAPHAWPRRARTRNAPSADRIVCRGRAGERVAPPRASVSDSRQPTEREVEAAAVGGPATSQGGVWIRIASSGRADGPGQRTVSSASLAWRALCLLADAKMLPPREANDRGHWAQLPRDLGRCRRRLESGNTKRKAHASGARTVAGTSPATGCAAAALRCQVADSPDHKPARPLPRLVA